MSAYPILPTYATHGMVATPHYLATQAGVRMRPKGGNAVDAAVAANLALAVVYHRWCSVGGDLFALVWDAHAQELRALNASGRAPQAMTPAAFAERGLNGVPRYGLLSVTVPGAVDGWHELISQHGKLDWAEVFQPAIEYAEEGFPISAKFTEAIESNRALLDQFPTTAAVFAPGGRIPQGGERFRQPDLALAARHRRRWTRRLLCRRSRQVYRCLQPEQWRSAGRSRPGRAPLQLGRADQRHLSRPPHL